MYLSIEIQLLFSGLVFLLAGGTILPMVRREYLQKSRLRQPAAILQLGVWFLFHVFLALAIWRELWPSLPAYIPKNWFGGLFMLAGSSTCLAGMGAFHSLTAVTGRTADRLVTSGIYRWTRNPQYTGYGLIMLGIVLGYWSPTAWLVLPAYALLVCATVRIEEEHLTGVFGEQYQIYCKQVPRFIGFRRPGKAAQ